MLRGSHACEHVGSFFRLFRRLQCTHNWTTRLAFVGTYTIYMVPEPPPQSHGVSGGPGVVNYSPVP